MAADDNRFQYRLDGHLQDAPQLYESTCLRSLPLRTKAKGDGVAEVCRMGGRHGRQSDYMVVSCSLLQSIRTARPVDWDVKNPGCGVGFRSLLMQVLRLFESLRCQGSMSHVLPTHLKPDVPGSNIIIVCTDSQRHWRIEPLHPFLD